MSKAEEKLYVSCSPTITEAESKVIKDIIAHINANSIIQVSPDNVIPGDSRWSYDEYTVTSTPDNNKYLLKLSFGDSQELVREYRVLKYLANTGHVPYAMSLHTISYFSDDGVATLSQKLDSTSLFDMGIHAMFSQEHLAREFFQALASFYAEDVSKKDLTILETAVTETIGETDNIFGDDAFIGFNEIYGLKKYSKDLLDLRREMTIKASQFNLGRLVNGNLNPFNIAGFRGDDTNAPGVYIADWTKSFVGNPLFDFYTLIVECGLFEEKKMLEKIFFEEVGKVDKKLENSIREVYVDYINYFHILKFWLCVREYISLLIEKNSGLDVTVRSVLLRQTFEGIKLNIFKIAPRFEKMFAEFCRLCEKIGEGKIKQQEEETYD